MKKDERAAIQDEQFVLNSRSLILLHLTFIIRPCAQLN